MAGPRIPGPSGLRTPHFGQPNTFTLGTGLALPGPLSGSQAVKAVDDDELGGIEDAAKRAARELVEEFAKRIGPGAFDALARSDIARGLLARIKNPSVIQQGPTQFCGPGSFIFSVASDDPFRYAQFAIELYENGQAMLGKLHVQPDDEVLHSSPPKSTIEPVDWMVLGSIRDSENWFFDIETGEDIKRNGTNPHEVAAWFRKAGYTKVFDESNLLFNKDEQNAREASNYFEQGYKVVLYLGMGAFFPKGDGTHFVALTSPIRLAAADVSFDIFTWGEGHHHLPQAGSTLTLKRFLDNYYGYIAAKL